jgi:hypothetical protein
MSDAAYLEQRIQELQDKVNELVVRHNQDVAYHYQCRKQIGQYYKQWWFRLLMFMLPPSFPMYRLHTVRPISPGDRMPHILDEEPTALKPTTIRDVDPHATPVKLRNVRAR